jgi:hypothetical protein
MMELSIALFISSLLMLSVLGSYSFLGRSLLRTGYAAQMESSTRTALYDFTSDVSLASSISTATASQIQLTTGGNTVVYTYSSAAGTLTRAVTVGTATTTTTLLNGLTTLSFSFFDGGSNSVTAASSVKLVSLAFTTAAGVATSGTRASLPIQSARVLMRNKGYLQ